MNENSSGLSPWKKPRSVVLTKSKSMKRKSKSFSVDLDSDFDDNESKSKVQNSPLSVIIENRNFTSNIFSVPRLSTNHKTDDDDMRHFFKGNIDKSQETSIDNNTTLNESEISEDTLNKTAQFLSQFQTQTSVLIVPECKMLIEKPALFDYTDLIPIDWSLKTRLRFCSKSQFKCCSNLKSIHESQAILNFSKLNEFYSTLEDCKNRQDAEDVYKMLFSESILYYMFPFLPWLKLYPRSLNMNLANSSVLPIDAQKNLLNNWTISFKSIYNSLKCNECPYFYLLSNSFMILFRTENIAGISELQAIMTPTTKGIRKTLKDEGISYTLPLMEKSSVNFEASPEKDDSFKENISVNNKNFAENVDKNEEKQEYDDEECDSNEWLETQGLKIRVLSKTRQSIRQDGTDSIDNKPQSTLFIQGGDVQALFNFLLNSKLLICNVGPMSGVPPTILSNQPFIGATMQKLKVQQAVVKNLSSTGESITQHTLDVTGPILPIHIHRLCNLFKYSQNGSFEMTGNALDNSASFNCTSPESDDILHNGHNLDLSEKKSMEKSLTMKNSASSINSIIFENELFKCY